MTTAPGFGTPVPFGEPDGGTPDQRYGGEPLVLRGAARDWPAVRNWSLAQLARLDPHRPVRVVCGNRERDRTQFADTTLSAYLGGLEREPGGDPGQEPAQYLKEFDLLSAFPQLRADLRPAELFPRRVIRSSSAWIGPGQARTGLHRDVLDNLAVLVLGRKRFLLASPGSVERRGLLSRKYDSWARLADVTLRQLAQTAAEVQDPPGARPPEVFLVADLNPGDALYVPRGWWHEVENLAPSVLLSGFFASPARIVPRWLTVTARDALHVAGLIGRQGCTCHPDPTGPG